MEHKALSHLTEDALRSEIHAVFSIRAGVSLLDNQAGVGTVVNALYLHSYRMVTFSRFLQGPEAGSIIGRGGEVVKSIREESR